MRLRVRVDGVTVLAQTFPAGGVHGDEPAVAIARARVSDGPHRVDLAIGETADPREWTFQTEQRMEFRAMRRRVVLFDRSTGFAVE